MTRKYALLREMSVTEIRQIEPEVVSTVMDQEKWSLILDIEGVSPAPQVGWIFSNNTLVLPPSATPQAYVQQVVIPAAKTFAMTLETNFITENILMGITQSGKTAGVVSMLTKKVDVAGVVTPVSIMDTLRAVCPSLTVTLQVLQYHIDHIEDYAELAPFITLARLNSLKVQIQTFLGIV